MHRVLRFGLGLALLASCASPPRPSGQAGNVVVFSPSPPPVTSPALLVEEAGQVVFAGEKMAYAGQNDSVFWPALKAAVQSKGGVEPIVTLQASRTVRVLDVLRAAHAASPRSIRIQSLDEENVLRVVELKSKSESSGNDKASDQSGCHLGAFLRPDGTIHVAAPGGARLVAGEKPRDQFTALVYGENAHCPLRYVGFGALATDGPWGPVFDLMVAVDRVKAAGDARYVLGILNAE